MPTYHYIACDLGAESGRIMLGRFEGGLLELEEIHRFANLPRQIEGSLHWDLPSIYAEIKIGLRLVSERGLSAASVSVDAWGVDYALYSTDNPWLASAYHYRDKRTEKTYLPVREKLGDKLIFEATGIQFMPINTLYHLAAEIAENGASLALSAGFLMIGDYFNYLLSGVACVEESNASTTQIYNPRTRSWSEKIIQDCGFPKALFPRIIRSGTVLGPLLENVSCEVGLSQVQVIATCSHDTGAAVAAIPADDGEDWAYLSSGTWSLLGVELQRPLINEAARILNFTNESGYGGTTRFLKNIVGLWLLQECRAVWMESGKTISYETLNQEAVGTSDFCALIRPDAPIFAETGHMPQKIAAYCDHTGQPAPGTPGQFVRCILESLALLYRTTLQEIETLTGRRIRRLHIVGGGSRSSLLNQFAADATGCMTLVGPVEATATGNCLIQGLALGHLTSMSELRAVVRRSFPLVTYTSSNPAHWEQAHARFTQLPLNL